MFRERTSVLSLDGRECKYQSRHQVQTDSWVLLDIDYTKAGQNPCRVQGQVKSAQTPRAGQGLFQIGVELEAAQSVKVVPNDDEDQVKIQEARTPQPPAAATEPKGRAEAASPLRPPAPQTKASAQTFSQPGIDPGAAGMTQSPELLAGIQTQVLTMAREAVKSALVSEISQHLGALKNSLSREVEKAVQATVASSMERMIHDAVEKQIAQQYQAAMEALNGDLSHQLAGRLAESEELRTSFEAMTKNLAERLTELSQTAAAKTEQDLNARVTAIRQSVEETIPEMQRRINEMRANLEATLTRAQASEKEAGDATVRVQEALERLRDADRIAAERLGQRLLSHLDACSTECNKRLDGIAIERAARFVSDVEQQLIPYLQRAGETLENLAAGMQLAQGSLRMQQEQLVELSQTAAASFEKDIKALFLRLSSNA